jgi:hypothetical protein
MTDRPVIDGRDRDQILAALMARVPGYIPEWTSFADKPGHALMAILARDIEIQAAAENGMPERARLAFLSMLGNSRLPAQSARAPLVFQLMANAPRDVTLADGSEVAARLPPSQTSQGQTPAAALIFSTQGSVTLTRASLATVYSIDPTADSYSDHSAALTRGFALFDTMQPVPHILYLGHDALFAISEGAEIELAVEFAAAHAKSLPRPLLIDWEYLSADGWLPLRVAADRTARFTEDGFITLRLDCGPDATQDKVFGATSYWIRGTVSARVPSGLIGPLAAGYRMQWRPIDALRSGAVVRVHGTGGIALVTTVAFAQVTLDRALSGARPEAVLELTAPTMALGQIARVTGASTLTLASPDRGRAVRAEATTSLSVAVTTAAQTSIAVASAAGFPRTGRFTILVEAEYMTVTAGQAATTWTVERGAYGSSAAPHVHGAPVVFSTAARATLFDTGGIDAAVTRLSVLGALDFPAATDFTILVGAEYMTVVAGHGTTSWTVVRGADGSTAAAHAQGASITLAEGPGLPTVIDAADGVAMLDRPLAGGAGAVLWDARTNLPIGQLVDPASDFYVPLDDGREFRPKDVVTVDGDTRAAVVTVAAHAVTLDAPIGDATPSNRLTLADAPAPLRPEGADTSGVLPRLDTIRTRVGFTKSNLAVDAAFCDTAPLDVANTFYPFGRQPQRFTTFYVASKEVFKRQGAQVLATVVLAQPGMGYGDGPSTQTNLGGNGLEAVATTLTVASTAGFPTAGTFTILIDSEYLTVIDGQGTTTWTVTRGAIGTTAAGHAANATVTLGPPQGVGPDLLGWVVEYFNGYSWVTMGPLQQLDDQTKCLTQSATISFQCPDDWAETKVNGQSNLWLRFRIDRGSYGAPMRFSVDNSSGAPVVRSFPATLAPPVIASLLLQYTYLTNANLLDHCITYNDFAFADHSEDIRWPRRWFEPFTPVDDRQPAIHFGFSQKLPSGLVSLYVAAAAGAAAPAATRFIWEYYGASGWVGLSVRDETEGFGADGVVQFIGPSDAVARPGLGGTLCWVRARLQPDIQATALPAAGIWLNAVWATQSEDVEDDTLGVSDGNPGQTFVFAPTRVPVLEGEIIEVREWVGRGDTWQTAVAGVPESQLRIERDPADGAAIAAWVRWQNRPHFYASTATDRHYVLERATGVLEFPTPPYGMIPPAGAAIQGSYRTGGGIAGNVPAGTITELHSGASYVQAVTNPFAASGGSDTESSDTARVRATQRLRHRDRAVAAADFEWLAREASPEVARARCLPITGPDGTGQRGWVTLVIVPNSLDKEPVPSSGLLDKVRAELAARAPAAIVANIVLAPPRYIKVGVRAEIMPRDAGAAATLEAGVRSALATFLHPLTGGPGKAGWQFGQSVHLSQVAALLEAIDGVDVVPVLQLLVDDGVAGDFVALDPDALIAEGDHQLKLSVEAA